jgi:ABC-type transport system involved in cytochrome bd biosynthesis fused ATPase/permease subunit
MNFKSLSAWIFVALVLLVLFMFLFPNNWVIVIGTVGVPILILAQTMIILKANEESKKEFSDKDWYDHT